MAGRDYHKEYYDKVHAYQDKKREERKAQENNSNFTILSMVGFAVGVVLFYGHGSMRVVVGTLALTALGALIGAGIDFYQMKTGKGKKK